MYKIANGEYIIEIPYEEFEKNTQMKMLYLEIFCDQYNIGTEDGKRLLDDYDMWFNDETMVKEILENCEDEIKKEFSKYF